MAQVTFTLNGAKTTVTVDSIELPLLWALRDVLKLTGTKYGCGVEICGACTVMVNGQPEKSCDKKIGEVAGANVMTIEGLKADPLGARLQKACCNTRYRNAASASRAC